MTDTEMDMLRQQLAVGGGGGYITLEVPPRPAAELNTPEALSRAADEVPYIEPERRSTGRRVSDLYAEILGATVVEPPREEPPAVIAARHLLYTDDTEKVPTREYKAYLDAKQAYDAARAAGKSGDAEWRKLQTTQPGRFEAALATIATFRQGGLVAAFASAQAAFAAGQRPGVDGPYVVCNPIPREFSTALPPESYDTSGEPGLAFMRVMLDRPWLRLALLTRAGWSVPGRGAGAYSNGRADASNTGLLALVPIALFIGWDEEGTPVILAWENLVLPFCPPQSVPP